MGATPEQFLQKEGRNLITNALAATLPYTPNEQPQWTAKEIEEQAMVTEHIVRQFKDLGLKASLNGPNNKRAGKLWHLNTIVTAEIPTDFNVSNLVKKLHPTPAVCGLPVAEAKAFIEYNEGYQRNFYTGFLGELNLDATSTLNLFVNLRCMSVEKDKVTIYVGGGITKDSNPSNEWQETVNKSKTMMDVL